MTDVEQRAAAKHFAEFWKGKGYERGESQKFWLSLLADVFGVEHAAEFITFEDQVHLDNTSFIDGFIPATHVLIEQKSLGKSLTAPIRQSDGSMLSPLQQAQRYVHALLDEKGRGAVPRWLVTCNFEEFRVYDIDNPQKETQVIKLADLPKEYHRLKFLVDTGNEIIGREMEISIKAGELVGKLYDAFLKQYRDPTSEHSLHSLNALCVRLVFCLYAEDSGIFEHLAFHDYLYHRGLSQARQALIDLFRVLDTKTSERDPYLDDELMAFPYVNGGLFNDTDIEIPRVTEEIYELLLRKASEDFDWSAISPTIFGAVFESTLNPETRRSGGMHYTSIENIHKVIDPLFLDDLKNELAEIKSESVPKTRRAKLQKYHEKLASLTWLDPAAGSGNFLTETYLCVRRLENEVILALSDGQIVMGDVINPIKVSISQFYGIEINDFAVTVARTALWIAESQMMKETEDIVHMPLDFLPLKTNATIVEGNALRMDWNSLRPMGAMPFIQMGNPPFVGARLMSNAQKQDVLAVFGSKWKNVGNLDYVCCWYKKATEMMADGNATKTALVSTNSVCQGETVANLWRPLMEAGVHIDFAYRTFRWDSEASIKAHVHCIIVGFSIGNCDKPKVIYDGELQKQANNINGYLIDADNVFVESRNKPLCDVPEIGIGNKPIDGGFYLFELNEMHEFIDNEPAAKPYFHPWYGAREFINNKPRYCLWLGDCTPAELRRLPECMKRVQAVREYRLASTSPGTVKLADKPTRFHVENMPKGRYIVIPQVSSQNRRYVPIGYMDEGVICSDKVRIMPEGSKYHFGVLTSNVHMSWMRTICCRLKSDYSYTVNDVYNNFPWPTPTEEQKAKIEKTAQAILDARALYPDSSLADLYDEVTMPPELRTAHQNNDKAVWDAYGRKWSISSESECVAALMRLYQELVTKTDS